MRKQHCLLHPHRSDVSLTSRSRIAPRVCGTSRHPREARTVELRSGAPRERSPPGLALETPFTLALFSLAGRRVVRCQARQIGLADEVASEERRASAVFQPTLGCLSRGSDPRTPKRERAALGPKPSSTRSLALRSSEGTSEHPRAGGAAMLEVSGLDLRRDRRRDVPRHALAPTPSSPPRDLRRMGRPPRPHGSRDPFASEPKLRASRIRCLRSSSPCRPEPSRSTLPTAAGSARAIDPRG